MQTLQCFFLPLKVWKNRPQKLFIIVTIFFFSTAKKEKSCTTKSPLMQDWVFRGINEIILPIIGPSNNDVTSFSRIFYFYTHLSLKSLNLWSNLFFPRNLLNGIGNKTSLSHTVTEFLVMLGVRKVVSYFEVFDWKNLNFAHCRKHQLDAT